MRAAEGEVSGRMKGNSYSGSSEESIREATLKANEVQVVWGGEQNIRECHSVTVMINKRNEAGEFWERSSASV